MESCFYVFCPFRSGLAVPANAEQRDRLYYENGILYDSISSLVTQTGLVLLAGTAEHPACSLFRQRREIYTLSLANLSGLTGARSPSGKVYIVENEMVFYPALRPRFAISFSADLHLRTAFLWRRCGLLDLLAREGTQLFLLRRFRRQGPVYCGAAVRPLSKSAEAMAYGDSCYDQCAQTYC